MSDYSVISSYCRFGNGSVAKLRLMCNAIHTWYREIRHILVWHPRHGMATVPATVLWVPLHQASSGNFYAERKRVTFLPYADHSYLYRYFRLSFVFIAVLRIQTSVQGHQLTPTESLFGTWHHWEFGVFGRVKTWAKQKPF